MTTDPKSIAVKTFRPHGGCWLQFAALALSMAFAQMALAVGPGFSLLRLGQRPDAFAYFEGLGEFEVVGMPIGPGAADTIIETFGETDDYGRIDAAVVGHAMRSTAPVVVSGRSFDVFINLDTSRASLGRMILGRYTDAFFHLFLNVSLVEGGTTVSVLPFDLQVSAIDEPGLPRPAGYPDDPRYPANGFYGELGFVGHGVSGSGYSNYVIHPLVAVPEPGGAALFLIGLVGLGAGVRWRRA